MFAMLVLTLISCIKPNDTKDNAILEKLDSLLAVKSEVVKTDSNNVVSTVTTELITDSLVIYYPFNGDANDKTTNKNNGIVVGAQLTTDRNGNENSAYYFNGSSDYIKINGGLPITNQFTISFWAYCENTSGHGTIISDGSSTVGGKDFIITFNGNDIGIRADKDATLNYEDNSPAELQNLDLLNRWVSVVWVMTPTYSKIYVNGIEKTTINETGSDEGYHDAFSFIGARQVWGSPDNFFKGKLDEIKIYNRILSDKELKSLY